MSLSVSIAFKQYPDAKLASFGNTVHQLMSVNTRYDSLKSFIDDLKVKNANNYAIRYKIKAETAWQDPIFSNKGEYVFTGLQPEAVYEFQIRAMGADGLLSDWSASVIIYVS